MKDKPDKPTSFVGEGQRVLIEDPPSSLVLEDGDASLGRWPILDSLVVETLAEPSPEALALQDAFAPAVSTAKH